MSCPPSGRRSHGDHHGRFGQRSVGPQFECSRGPRRRTRWLLGSNYRPPPLFDSLQRQCGRGSHSRVFVFECGPQRFAESSHAQPSKGLDGGHPDPPMRVRRCHNQRWRRACVIRISKGSSCPRSGPIDQTITARIGHQPLGVAVANGNENSTPGLVAEVTPGDLAIEKPRELRDCLVVTLARDEVAGPAGRRPSHVATSNPCLGLGCLPDRVGHCNGGEVDNVRDLGIALQHMNRLA